jgi:hypothetical protein
MEGVQQIRSLFEKLDLNKNGKLEYNEFLAANLRRLICKKLMTIGGVFVQTARTLF